MLEKENMFMAGYVEGREDGKLAMLRWAASAYYGKEYYFEEEDGFVYSRRSHKSMTLDEAIVEFMGVLEND